MESLYSGWFVADRRLSQANAEESGKSDELVDTPKVEEKLAGAVPSGLSTDSDFIKRYVRR